jgi:hypothetical protein
MYVVRQGQTKKGMLQVLNNIHQDKKLRNLAVVLNGMKSNSRTGYGYGYGYGYYEPDKSFANRFKEVLQFWKQG